MEPFDDSNLRNLALCFKASQTQSRISNIHTQASTHHTKNFSVPTPIPKCKNYEINLIFFYISISKGIHGLLH